MDNRRPLACLVLAARCLMLIALPACGGGEVEVPRWVDLAEGFEPRPLHLLVNEWAADSARANERGTAAEVDEEGAIWVTARLAAEDWQAEERPGTWSIPRPRDGAFQRAGEGAARITSSDHELVAGSVKDRVRPGMYLVAEDVIFLSLGEQEKPTGEFTFAVRLDHGQQDAGSWRVQTPTHSGYGIPVFSDSREELETTIPPHSRLRFATGFSSLERADGPRVTYRVLLDDELLFEREARHGEHFEVDLPEAGRPEARLAFEVRGGDGMGVFFVPSLGPSSVGDYRARPWGPDRPDMLVFIADTFRADNMAIYGGDASLTPNLNRFAEESLCFLRARSTAAWTLPSISSVLTGLFPGQHGATQEHLSLSRDLRTISKTFGEHGYRTCAVTDSGFFSPAFGLDQGFDLFVENRIHRWNLTKTIDQALAWLDADDGRPTLLVVHTYRVHGPFRHGAEEDQSVFDKFMSDGFAEIDAAPDQSPENKRRIFMGHLDEWVGMYEDGVRDMDVKFGRFLAATRERGVLEEGALVFLGDHGQAHGENDDIAHAGKLWDSKLRIPLVLHGGSIDPGTSDNFVSLVDVAPTLTRLARLPPESEWVGSPLFEVSPDRPSFAFQLEGEGKREMAILKGPYKVFTDPDAAELRRGEVRAAFDIVQDPGETRDLASTAEWPAGMAREAADAVELFLTPKSSAPDADVDLEMRRRMGDIGYTGGN